MELGDGCLFIGEEIYCLVNGLTVNYDYYCCTHGRTRATTTAALQNTGCQDTITTTTTAATTTTTTTTATATTTTKNNNNFIAYSHAINLNAARIQPSIGKRMLICYALFCLMLVVAFSAFKIGTLFLTSHLFCEFTCLGL
jgi:hypothetical protein